MEYASHSAWLNNKVEDHVVQLTMSQPNLENIAAPGVSGSTVTLSCDGGVITFTENTNNPSTYR